MAASMTYIYSQGQHGHLLPYMAALHASCILVDQTVGPFLPPLTNDKLLPWWKQRIAEANQGSRVIVLLLPETAKPEGADLRGLAMLKLSETETGAFRGHIDAVLVGSKYRRQGGAKALATALEYEAAKRGRTLLLADAETGSIAEAAFKKFGYAEIGKVPAFSQTLSSSKKGQTFFYKDLLPATSP